MPPDELGKALALLKARAAAYDLYGDYYRGKQRLAFASKKFNDAFGSLFQAFADNLCATVVDAVGDRLTLVGFGTEGRQQDGVAVDSPAAQAWALWKANRMDEQSAIVHTEALACGDAYLIAWTDSDGNPRLYPNPARRVVVVTDDERPELALWAAKVWPLDDGRVRATLYYPDRIEKYVTRAKSSSALPDKPSIFQEYEVEGESWPLPNPYGRVPVFHFANNRGMHGWGRSELEPVIPLQDGLNKSIADMLVAAEFLALPQRYAIGLEVETDPTTGKAKAPFSPGADRIWAVANDAVKFGQFDPADLDGFLREQDSFRTEIARVSRTPLHYLTPISGDFPSGESLRTAEAPFLSKVKRRQVSYGNVWEDCFRFLLQMTNGPDVALNALWQDPTPKGEKEQAETVQIKRLLGVSEAQGLSELGYSPEQIQQMQTQATDEIKRRQMLASADVVDEATMAEQAARSGMNREMANGRA